MSISPVDISIEPVHAAGGAYATAGGLRDSVYGVVRRMRAQLYHETLEALSPTRCVGCERLGPLVCDRCLSALTLIDPVHSCCSCGAPYGDLLCTECARDRLHAGPGQGDGAADSADSPLDRCLAMAVYEGPLPRMIRGYKDAGERRMASLFAELLADTALHAQSEAPERYGGLVAQADALVFVPVTERAYRRRGFDHMEAVARPLARLLGMPLLDALAKHGKTDQRELDREERQRQSRGVYQVVAPVAGMRLLLVDDVVTTGATMRAVAAALKDAGAASVDGLALARVW